MATILSLETSCDETGVAILTQSGPDAPAVLSQSVSSQINIHALTGGVVPETAAREHSAVIAPMILDNLRHSGLQPSNLDAIAITVGPGLIPALVVGVATAQTLSFAWDKPLVPVHHLEGHIYSALLSAPSPDSLFPALALIVSGGHTLLVLISAHLTYQILGSTLDDAAGEAFDKVARLLGLPYPGGPALSRLAESGNPSAFDFPRPMLHDSSLNFSFSGLKTAVLYTFRDLTQSGAVTAAQKADIAASFQQAVVDVLVAKAFRAASEYHARSLLLTGGVAANQLLRQTFQLKADQAGLPLLTAPLELCGDNGVMIGQAGLYAFAAGRVKSWSEIEATARLSIETFSPSTLQ